ncbi:MAG: hypothetical protein AAFY57_09925 [Cyanobacteria bacterium J06642_2]
MSATTEKKTAIEIAPTTALQKTYRDVLETVPTFFGRPVASNDIDDPAELMGFLD